MANGQSPDETGFKAENEIDLVLGNANPNPARVGCPPRDALTALARRERPIDDPAYDHLIKCSPCYREVRALQQRSALRPSGFQSPRRWAAVAAAVIIIGVAAGWLVSSRSTRAVPGNEVAPVTRTPELSAQLDLRKYTAIRGEEKRPDLEPLSLPPGRVQATILLPVGSEPGEYEIQVLDADLRSRVSANGTADLRDHVTTLQAMLDLSSVNPGAYQLAVRRHNEEWRMFPLRLATR
jgi:hypothetical protein